MICHECIHKYCCKYDRFFGVDAVEDKCAYFKNKSDYAEVKHGYWEEIKCGDGIFDYCFKCSNCGKITPPKAFPVAPDYCPNCPAKMDGERSDT